MPVRPVGVEIKPARRFPGAPLSASDSRSPLISANTAAPPSSKRARTITVNRGGSRSAPTTPKKRLGRASAASSRPRMSIGISRTSSSSQTSSIVRTSDSLSDCPAPDLEPELDSRIAGVWACQPVLEQARHPFPEQYDVLDIYG